jgi:eukaryotic-like serine/threonine-protein kinase
VSSTTNQRNEELIAGQMLGRYELLMPIAKGGMGNVWAARLNGTRGFRKLVAIKTISRSLEHAGLEQMLFQEAVLASQIHHPNVAETLELGEHEGTLYLVMELVSGESLRFILREAQARGGIPLYVCVNLIGQVCRGLAAAHDLRDKDGERVGLVHRDISPPNIMITDAGTVKIVDFGVATTSSSGSDASGEIKGKISYLAPEQLLGEALDARVDVFATGILLYLLTLGQHPFRQASEASTITRILSKAPATTPSVLAEDYPDALEQIVMRALHKDREQRFQSAAAMLEALLNAFPSAFGPRPDGAAALYLQDLMKERILERKASLRMAEELAEKSSPTHSAYSLPVVTTSSAPTTTAHRRAPLGLGGLFMGLAAAALAGTLYLQGLRQTTLHQPAAILPGGPPAAAAATLSTASPALDRWAEGGASIRTPSSAASLAQLVPNSAPRAKRARSHHLARDERAELLVDGSSSERPTPTAHAGVAAQIEVAPPEAPRPPAEVQEVQDGSQALRAQAPAPPIAPPPAATHTLVGPRILSSKLGQNQLLTNPASAPSRVRLPAGLNRVGETFSAIVNICVTASGSVSKVNILRSAGPALDPQIPAAISHWRYRPLLEAGKPTPFCYRVNYEIGAR